MLYNLFVNTRKQNDRGKKILQREKKIKRKYGLLVEDVESREESLSP